MTDIIFIVDDSNDWTSSAFYSVCHILKYVRFYLKQILHAFIPSLITNLSHPSFTPHFAYVKADRGGATEEITLNQCSDPTKCVQLFKNVQFDNSLSANYGK